MKARPAPDPAELARRAAVAAEREAAAAAKRAAVVEAREAEKRAAEEAARLAAEEAAAKLPVVPTQAELKAARDARYAARKARK